MSWDAWVNPLTASGTNECEKAGIYGVDGAAWFQTSGMNASAAEIKAIVSGISNPGACAASGCTLEGKKYMFLRADGSGSPAFLMAKKGATGFAAYKTAKAVIVGVYDETRGAENCSKGVGRQADALLAAGF